MLLPLGADWLCAVQSGEIHATPFRHVLGARRRRTVDVVCGRKRAKVYVAPAVERSSDEDLGLMPLVWPPPARHDGYRRCAACWEATGRKRPAAAFRELRQKAGAA